MKSALAILLTAILPCFPHHASAGFGDTTARPNCSATR
jgi:hypothetical protein